MQKRTEIAQLAHAFRKSWQRRTLVVAVVAAIALCAFVAAVPSANASPRPLSHAAAKRVRMIFPYFAYITAGGFQDNQIAADAWGVPVESYIDMVCADLARHGFNVAWLNNIDYAVLPAWIRAAKRHGLKVIAQSSTALSPGTPSTPTWGSIDRREVDEISAFYRGHVRRYRGDRTLLMYVISEEPPPSRRLLNWFQSAIRAVNEADPTHATIVEYNDVDSARLAARVLKPPVIVFGVGPFKHGDSDEVRRYFFPLIMEQSYHAARSAGAPLWILTQGSDFDIYEDGVFTEKSSDRPTRAQLRWEVWSALLHGAKGIGYFLYSWQFPVGGRGYEEDLHGLVTRDGKETEIYDEAARASSRLASIKRLLLRLDAVSSLDDPKNPYWQTEELVRSRTFVDRRTKRRYLMVVNYDFEQERSFRPAFSSGISQFTDMITGQVLRNDTTDQITLAPGDGTLLRIE